MELTLANSPRTSPQADLEAALQEYERILSWDERNHLHAQALPDASAAIKLTTAIDSSSRLRHCLGQRLMTFLESVQHFSGVVDTFVSSRPELAALVWGGVKLALIAAVNGSSYFDKLSALFMRIGQKCPRYEEFGLLYPSSKRLQGALCDYYAVVIRLCKQVTVSSRKPAPARISQAVFNPFEKEFGPYERRLEQLSKDIQEEMALASKQAQVEEANLQARERDEARLSRSMLSRLGDKISRRDEDTKKWQVARDQAQLQKYRLRFLESQSTYDHQQSFKQIRKECVPGTSTWILDDADFQSWVEGSVKTLWCTGKIGSGKSTISASVIAHMASLGNTTLYFFCRHDDQESLKAPTIFGSIIRQLASTLPARVFGEHDHRNSQPASILRFLESKLDLTKWYPVILDGFDECEKDQLREIDELFFKIMGSCSIQFRLFFSSRPNIAGWPSSKVRFEKHIDLETARNREKVTFDIHKFIIVSITEHLEGETPELLISDPELVLIIVERLEKEAQGMFLWVKYQLQALCEENSDSEILVALENLPPDLPKTYERILHRSVKGSDYRLVRRIFRWLIVARRPLCTGELREAVGIEPFQEEWDDKKFVNNIEMAIASCGNLVFVDEELQTVHFTHTSVKQFLLSYDVTEPLTDYHLEFEEADAEVGITCMTYLNFPVFNTQIEPTAKVKANITGLPSMAIQRGLGLPSANMLALELMRRKHSVDESVDRRLQEAYDKTRNSYQRNPPNEHAFLSYAKRFWLEHTKRAITPTSGKIWTLWRSLLEQANSRDLLSGVPWDFEDWQFRNPRAVRWVSANDHRTLAHLILHCHGIPDRTLDELPEDMLSAIDAEFLMAWSQGRTNKLLYDSLVAGAAAKGHQEIVSISLDSGLVPHECLGSVLHSAATGGHLDIVQRMIAMGVDVNTFIDTHMGGTALAAAAAGGHLPIVEILLRNKADVNPNPSHNSDRRRAALQAAAGNGHLAVVERLLQAKADVNAIGQDHRNKTPLGAAAYGGHLVIVERLLQADADINLMATQPSVKTPLQAAAEGGFLTTIERLLEVKSDVNAPAPDGGGWTALQAAASNGHLAAVKRLLQVGADINAPATPWSGRTAIQGAARGGHLAIVETLLDAGADVNAPAGEHGLTALSHASREGHTVIIERLRAAGATV